MGKTNATVYSHRTSQAIGQKGAQSLYYALVEQASRIGRPLSVYVTLNFSAGRRPVHEAVEAFAEMRRHRFNKWCRRPTVGSGPPFEPTYVYSFENRRDDLVFETVAENDDHNVHAHWAVYVPPSRLADFEVMVWRWFEEAVQGFDSPTAVDIRRIDDPVGLRRYFLKGSTWAPLYGSIHKPQGTILGRRSGTSLNLGKSARMKADREAGIRRRIPARPRAR